MTFNHRIRYGIAPTLACNLSCAMCNRLLDIAKWPKSDMRVKEVAEGGRRVRQAGLLVNRVRLTGGEPMLHRDIRSVVDAVYEHWKPERAVVVITNRTKPLIADLPVRYTWPNYYEQDAGQGNVATAVQKGDGTSYAHWQWMVSPHDLGLRPEYGPSQDCQTQIGCGRGFDCYGFTFCVLAGSLGRLLGKDPYSATPVLRGDPEICKYCIHSQSRRKKWELQKAAAKGEIECPSKTFREAIKDDVPPVTFKRFEERV